MEARRKDDTLTASEKSSGVRAVLRIDARIVQPAAPPTTYDGPGRRERVGIRAPGILCCEPIRPRKRATPCSAPPTPTPPPSSVTGSDSRCRTCGRRRFDIKTLTAMAEVEPEAQREPGDGAPVT
jgi:hypothetical protein